MRRLEYPLYQNGYINRFLTAGVFVKKSPYSDATLQGRVNEWLIKGPAIHDHPDRAKFIAKRIGSIPEYISFENVYSGDEVTAMNENRTVSVYFPFGNTGVDCSAFYSNPAFIRCYACSFVYAPAAENSDLLISTCGAMTLWINDRLVTDYTPFERNVCHTAKVKAPLEKGFNKFVICFDDLAERDTDFGFRIRYLGEQELTINIPVRDSVEPEEVYRAEESLSGMYFDKECYRHEPVGLNITSFTDKKADIKILSDRAKMKDSYELIPGTDRIMLFDGENNPSGFCHFEVKVNVSGLRMSKVIGTYCLNDDFDIPCGKTYLERKMLVQDIIANEKGDDEYSMLINLLRNTPLDNTDDIIRGHLDWIVNKKDCSDFRMIIVAYAYARFKHLLSETIADEMKSAMLGYRYWCDEPGNDVMWFFSENHAILFHVSQYIAGTSLPDEVFTVSKMTGKQAAAKAEGLLNEWFDMFFNEFVSEWNSSTYVPVDVTALAYLYDFTPKTCGLHIKAKKALDMLAFSFAVYEHDGVIQSTFGRTYEKELKGCYSSGMPSLLYLLYGTGHMNKHFRALTPLVICDYEPPCEYEKYTGLDGSKELVYCNTQGIDNLVNLYLYKNAAVSLSTAVNYNPYGAGYQENITEASIDGIAQVFINHPGETAVYGKGRPGLWAGNGCLPKAMQYENIGILHYHIGDEYLIDYTHAYAPLMEFDDCAMGGNAIALAKNGGFIGIKAKNGISVTGSGPCRNRELVSPGRDNVWVIKVGTPKEYDNVGELLKDMERMTIDVAEGRVIVTDEDRTYVMEGNDLFVNGNKAFDYPMGVMGTPRMKGL